MSIIPLPENEQTLYSVVPLALDLENINVYMKYLSNPNGDCQLFTDQELPCNFFTYEDKQFSILLNSNAHYVQKDSKKKGKSGVLKKTATHNIHCSPFTTLLVGSSYSCTEVMKTYHEWAKLDSHSLITVPHNTSVRPVSKEKITVWKSILHPHVWSMATFSSVIVTTAYPNLLQEELRRIFDFPIVVIPTPPISKERHNEFSAWLTAIYSLVASRNLYRPVLCHSKSWHAHLQFYTHISPNNFIDFDVHVPKLWRPLIQQTQAQFSTTPNSDNTIKFARLHTAYDIRKHTYQHETCIDTSIIGLGHVALPLFSTKTYATLSHRDDFFIVLTRTEHEVTLLLPVHPSTTVQYALKSIISTELRLPIEFIQIHYNNCTCIISDGYSYSLLANMTLQALSSHMKRKKRAGTFSKKITLAHCNSLKNKKIRASVVLDMEIRRYSRELYLKKACVVLDAGYIAHKNVVKGVIEQMVNRTACRLCGHNNIVSLLDYELETHFLTSSNSLYTASVSILVTQATYLAFVHALTSQYSHPEKMIVPLKELLS